MSEYRVTFSNGRRPRKIEADWYKKMGQFVHFFVHTADGGGQTVWRIPVSAVAQIEDQHDLEAVRARTRMEVGP